MDLGAFSISLPVQDLAASIDFYGTLGFAPTGGDVDEGWCILRNDAGVTVGLFVGMFDEPMLTFNPGLAQDMSETSGYTDVREAQARLVAAGHDPIEAVDESGSGPGHLVVRDPDGHLIMIDQFR